MLILKHTKKFHEEFLKHPVSQPAVQQFKATGDRCTPAAARIVAVDPGVNMGFAFNVSGDDMLYSMQGCVEDVPFMTECALLTEAADIMVLEGSFVGVRSAGMAKFLEVCGYIQAALTADGTAVVVRPTAVQWRKQLGVPTRKKEGEAMAYNIVKQAKPNMLKKNIHEAEARCMLAWAMSKMENVC